MASGDAQAMARGLVKMDTASSSTATTDVSAGVVGFNIKPTKSIGKHFVINSDWQLITEGGMGITVTMKVEITKKVAHIYTYLWTWLMTSPSSGGHRTIDLYTPDASTGSLYVTGEYYIDAPDTLMNVDGGKGDAQIATFTLHSDSTITIAAAA